MSRGARIFVSRQVEPTGLACWVARVRFGEVAVTVVGRTREGVCRAVWSVLRRESAR